MMRFVDAHDGTIKKVTFGDGTFSIECQMESGARKTIHFGEVTTLCGWQVWAGNIILDIESWKGKEAPERLIQMLMEGTSSSREGVDGFVNRYIGTDGFLTHISPSYGAEWLICSRKAPLEV